MDRGRELQDSAGAEVSPLRLRIVPGLRHHDHLLARFQGTGQVRAGFDPLVVAMAIRAAIDAVPPRLARDDQFDVAHHGRELADLFVILSPAAPPPTTGPPPHRSPPPPRALRPAPQPRCPGCCRDC